jgi:hypothetical protein
MSGAVDSASDERTANNAVRHQYRTLSEAEKAAMVSIKDKGAEFLNLLDNLQNGGELPLASTVIIGREFALARTKIEEAVMWAVKGLTK